MSKGKEMAKNTIIILIGKICTQFLSFFLLPLYTSFLKSDEFGVVDLITTYVSLLVPCITLQIENALFRFLVEQRENEEKKKKIITNTLFSVIYLLLICMIIYEVIGIFVYIKYQYYVLGIIVFTIFSNIMLQMARGVGDNIGYSIGSLVAGGTTILLNVLFLTIFHFGPKGMLLSLILANQLCAIYLVIREKAGQYICFECIDKKECYRLLKYSIPLVPNSIIWWIINVSDRTLITFFLGVSSNGIYAVANKFSNAIMSVYYVFNMSWTESASLYMKDKDSNKFFSEMFETMFHLFASICLCVMAGMSFIFPIMVNAAYIDAYDYIPILMVGCLFNVFVGLIGAVYVALKRTKEIAQTSITAGVINFTLNIGLIKFLGLYAASLSTAIAFIIMSIYRYKDVQQYVRLEMKRDTVLRVSIVYIISIILYYQKNNIANIVNINIALLYSLHCNRKIIFVVMGKLKEILMRHN